MNSIRHRGLPSISAFTSTVDTLFALLSSNPKHWLHPYKKTHHSCLSSRKLLDNSSRGYTKPCTLSSSYEQPAESLVSAPVVGLVPRNVGLRQRLRKSKVPCRNTKDACFAMVRSLFSFNPTQYTYNGGLAKVCTFHVSSFEGSSRQDLHVDTKHGVSRKVG
jgi:hypothetical protein